MNADHFIEDPRLSVQIRGAFGSVPPLKLTSAALWFRLIAALLLLAAGGLLILAAVVIAGSESFLKAGLVILPGFVILGASVWLMIRTYERLH